MANDEARDIMAIAGADGCDLVTVIEKGEPITIALHEVGLNSARIDHFDGIEGEIRTAQVIAGNFVEVSRREGNEVRVIIAGMVENDDSRLNDGAD